MLNSTITTSNDKHKDLGILDFHSHTHQKFQKPFALWVFSVKFFQYLDNNMLINLYKTIVHPVLLFGVHLTSSPLKKSSKEKLILTLQHLSYTDRLVYLKVAIIIRRRLRGDMILM